MEFLVLDGEELVGRMKMPLKKFLESNEEQHFSEEFVYNEVINAGTLKFHTMLGPNPVFSEIKNFHSKMLESHLITHDAHLPTHDNILDSRIEQRRDLSNIGGVVNVQPLEIA